MEVVDLNGAPRSNPHASLKPQSSRDLSESRAPNNATQLLLHHNYPAVTNVGNALIKLQLTA